MTRADILRHSIMFSLIGVKAGRNKLRLTDEQRRQVADEAIRVMRQHGEWAELDVEVKPVTCWPTEPPKRQ